MVGNFFREELEAFILLCLEQGLSINKIKGSYAGALGIPQFMPSSWRTFAIDFDQNGKTNLLTSPKDAIGSVANYLNKHGWDRNIPTHSVANTESQGQTQNSSLHMNSRQNINITICKKVVSKTH